MFLAYIPRNNEWLEANTMELLNEQIRREVPGVIKFFNSSVRVIIYKVIDHQEIICSLQESVIMAPYEEPKNIDILNRKGEPNYPNKGTVFDKEA